MIPAAHQDQETVAFGSDYMEIAAVQLEVAPRSVVQRTVLQLVLAAVETLEDKTGSHQAPQNLAQGFGERHLDKLEA
jgi:hypothetical protein